MNTGPFGSKMLRESIGGFLEAAGMKLTIAHRDDWECLYVNGKPILKASKIKMEDVLPIEIIETDLDWPHVKCN